MNSGTFSCFQPIHPQVPLPPSLCSLPPSLLGTTVDVRSPEMFSLLPSSSPPSSVQTNMCRAMVPVLNQASQCLATSSAFGNPFNLHHVSLGQLAPYLRSMQPDGESYYPNGQSSIPSANQGLRTAPSSGFHFGVTQTPPSNVNWSTVLPPPRPNVQLVQEPGRIGLFQPTYVSTSSNGWSTYPPQPLQPLVGYPVPDSPNPPFSTQVYASLENIASSIRKENVPKATSGVRQFSNPQSGAETSPRGMSFSPQYYPSGSDTAWNLVRPSESRIPFSTPSSVSSDMISVRSDEPLIRAGGPCKRRRISLDSLASSGTFTEETVVSEERSLHTNSNCCSPSSNRTRAKTAPTRYGLSGEKTLSIDFVSFGQFPSGVPPQLFGRCRNVIPHQLKGRFVLYNQPWEFSIAYDQEYLDYYLGRQDSKSGSSVHRLEEALDSMPNGSALPLTFELVNLDSGLRVSRTETPKDAIHRQALGQPKTCSEVVREAFQRRATEIETVTNLTAAARQEGTFVQKRSLMRERTMVRRLRDYSANEANVIFGLHHRAVQEHWKELRHNVRLDQMVDMDRVQRLIRKAD